MALGRQGSQQAELLVTWAEMPRSPGHVFYDRLQAELVGGGFDAFVEGQCAPYYAARRGRPSLPPGRYFRMLLVGYFEGIHSERGLEWHPPRPARRVGGRPIGGRQLMTLAYSRRACAENLQSRVPAHVIKPTGFVAQKRRIGRD